MVIPSQIVEELIAHAQQEFPNECCGLLAAVEGIPVKAFPIANQEASPVNYYMAPQEQLTAMLEIDDSGWDLMGIYHSHTRTAAYPSPTDVRLAVYPDQLYLIVSLASAERPEIRAFRIRTGAIEEEPVEFLAS